MCNAESVIRCCTENDLFAMEYPGIIQCTVMRAQDALIIPFQLSWQELGSCLQQSRHGYLSFYYHCPCDRQVLLLYCSSWFSEWRSKLLCHFHMPCWEQLLQNNFCNRNFISLSTSTSVFFLYYFFFLSLYLIWLTRKLKPLVRSIFWRSCDWLSHIYLSQGEKMSYWKT